MNAKPVFLELDEDGKEIVRVKLGRFGEEYATIERQDYYYLLSLGVSANWFRSVPMGYVHTSNIKAPGKQLSVARVLLDCGPQETIRYINPRNKSDLRRKNL